MTKTPREVCRLIMADMEADAAALDGQPFNGRVVAQGFGNLMAAVNALARIVEELCPNDVAPLGPALADPCPCGSPMMNGGPCASHALASSPSAPPPPKGG